MTTHFRYRITQDPFSFERNEESIEDGSCIVSPARRSAAGEPKVRRQRMDDGEPARSFETLMQDLKTLTKNRVRLSDT